MQTSKPHSSGLDKKEHLSNPGHSRRCNLQTLALPFHTYDLAFLNIIHSWDCRENSKTTICWWIDQFHQNPKITICWWIDQFHQNPKKHDKNVSSPGVTCQNSCPTNLYRILVLDIWQVSPLLSLTLEIHIQFKFPLMRLEHCQWD